MGNSIRILGVPHVCRAGWNLSQRLLVGIDGVAGCFIGRSNNRLVAHAAPGLEVRRIGYVVILDLELMGFDPFAIFPKLDAVPMIVLNALLRR